MSRVTILTPFNPTPAARKRNPGKHGGVERYTWQLAKALTATGFRVTIVASDDATTVQTSDSIEVRTVARVADPFKAPLFDWLRPIRASRADLVHVQGSYPFVSELAPLVSRLLGIPSVLTYHFDIVGRTPPARLAVAQFYRLFRRTIRFYDRLIFLSRPYLESSPVFQGVPMERVRFGNVGVDIENFHPLPVADPQESFLFVGRLAPFKGLDVLLDVVARLKNVRLTIVGDGELREYVARRLTREHLAVDWKRGVSDEELRRLYNESIATVLPSTDRQECVGTVLMESLACGTNVIASDLPGLRYVSDFGGILVPPGDQDALAGALGRVAPRSMTSADRDRIARRAASQFAWPKVVEQVVRVYDEIL